VRKAGCQLTYWKRANIQVPGGNLRSAALLYVRGNEQVLDYHAISIVGTRRPAPYGNQTVESLVRPGQSRPKSSPADWREGSTAQPTAVPPRAEGRSASSVPVATSYIQTEPKAFRAGREARRHHDRISYGDLSRAREFFGVQPNGGEDGARPDWSAGSAVFGFADSFAAGHGVWPRRLRCAGKRRRAGELCTEPAH